MEAFIYRKEMSFSHPGRHKEKVLILVDRGKECGWQMLPPIYICPEIKEVHHSITHTRGKYLIVLERTSFILKTLTWSQGRGARKKAKLY